MSKIYERNPDTGEIRERDFNDYQTAADSMRDMNRDDHLNRDTQSSPYRNEMTEILDVLKRIDLKLEFLASKDKNDYTSYQMWLDTRDEQACICYERYSTIERDDYLPSANAR